jgi:hypothetical protein
MDDSISDLAANLQQRDKACTVLYTADLRLVVVDWVGHVCARQLRATRETPQLSERHCHLRFHSMLFSHLDIKFVFLFFFG